MKKYLLIVLLLVVFLSAGACISSNPLQNSPDHPPKDSGNMTVHFINVWRVESILIQSPTGKIMLIDAGDEDHGKIVSLYLKNLSITSLDVVVNSYPSEAYIGKMATILQDFNVREFIGSGHSFDMRPDGTYMRKRSLIDGKKKSHSGP